MDLASELLALIESFHAAGIEFALCGGMAMAIHGFPRYTKGIDFLIRLEDARKELSRSRQDVGSKRIAASCVSARRRDHNRKYVV